MDGGCTGLVHASAVAIDTNVDGEAGLRDPPPLKAFPLAGGQQRPRVVAEGL